MNAHGKNNSARPWPAHTPCPQCGAFPELNDRGEVRKDWRESYGHRAPDGEPCPGIGKAARKRRRSRVA